MFDVLYIDNHLLVIRKPHGLLSQADATGDADVVSIAKQYLKERFDKPGNVFVGLVHRLDRPASGVMVLARTSKAASRLSEQFRERSPSKHYLAIVEGKSAFEGTLSDYLRKDDNRHVSVVDRGSEGAQHAELVARTLATGMWRDGTASLVSVELLTGRSHQVRVQLAHRGNPIIGDLRYGARTPYDGRNLALHAWRLEIDHPTLRTRMQWHALPGMAWFEAFGDSMEQLRNEADQLRGNE